MASLTIILLRASLVAVLVAADNSITSDLLWPKPKSAQFGSNIYTVDQSFQFLGTGPGSNSNILKAAFDRYQALIFKTPSPFYPSGNTGQAHGALSSMTVTVSSDDETLDLQTDESCRLLYTVKYFVTSSIVNN